MGYSSGVAYSTNRSSSTFSDPNAGAGYVVILAALGAVGWGLWAFVVQLLAPALALAGTLVARVEWLNLGLDALLGAAAGGLAGWLRWRCRRKSEAVESLLDAMADPDALRSRYLWLHVGAGLLAGAIVGLLGIGVSPALPGMIVLGGGGAGGGGGGLLLLALFFLLLVALPLVVAGLSLALAAGLSGAASGAASSGGKMAGLALFLALTRMKRGLSKARPAPPRPAPAPDPGPFDLDRIVEDWLSEKASKRRGALKRFKAWLEKEGAAFDAAGIGENAPRYKDPHVYDLARRLNYELARRRPGPDPRVAEWEALARRQREEDEKRLFDELVGPGWKTRAWIQGLWIGALNGTLTSLIVAAALALFS